MTPTEVRARVTLELLRRDLERLRERWPDLVAADPGSAFERVALLAAAIGRLEAALTRCEVRSVAVMRGRIEPASWSLN